MAARQYFQRTWPCLRQSHWQHFVFHSLDWIGPFPVSSLNIPKKEENDNQNAYLAVDHANQIRRRRNIMRSISEHIEIAFGVFHACSDNSFSDYVVHLVAYSSEKGDFSM
jgi:hypothetical protein